MMLLQLLDSSVAWATPAVGYVTPYASRLPVNTAGSTEESEGDEVQTDPTPDTQEGESQKMDYTLGDESLGGSSHAYAGKMERIAKTQPAPPAPTTLPAPEKPQKTDTQEGESQKMDYTLGDESLGGSCYGFTAIVGRDACAVYAYATEAICDSRAPASQS
ncbi:hypothetical protein BDZ91DRAFT_768224 [Kalaharituber pfeilii]|nr:hypothetical protein BDZ91DRAFT_768224 [Kalaharituber pfeilii]